MGATGARGELGRPGRWCTKSGNVADDGDPLGLGVSIGLRVFLVVEHRNRVACEDHRHRQRNCDAKAAFVFLCFVLGAHFGLPFVRFAGVLPACKHHCRERANFVFSRKLAISLSHRIISASKYCQQVVKHANV